MLEMYSNILKGRILMRSPRCPEYPTTNAVLLSLVVQRLLNTSSGVTALLPALSGILSSYRLPLETVKKI